MANSDMYRYLNKKLGLQFSGAKYMYIRYTLLQYIHNLCSINTVLCSACKL